MRISISYDEIKRIIKDKYNKDISIDKIDNKTIRVGCQPCPQIYWASISLNIVDINKDCITIRYEDYWVSLVIELAQIFVSHLIPDFIKIDRNSQQIWIPSRIQKGKFGIDIDDIEFDEYELRISASNLNF